MDAVDWSYKFNNLAIFGITKCKDMPEYISQQNLQWVALVCRTNNDTLTKQLMFSDVRFCKVGYHHKSVLETVISKQIEIGKSKVPNVP